MTSSTYLRVASIIALLYFAGHSAGIPWTPAVAPEEVAVLEAMKSQSFSAQGFQRTYWDFYFGFGVIISGYLLVQAVALWQLGAIARADALGVRPIVASFLVAFVVNAVPAWRYFFAVPAVLAGTISICLALAFVTANRTKAP
jgi:hypothetical protein